MSDIIRFQFRQLFTKRIVYLANLLVLLVCFIMLFLNGESTPDIRETLTAYLPQTASFAASIALMAPMIMIGMVCGDDFEDKTINHELTAGRSRAASFFGRAIPVMIAAPLTALVLLSIPYAVYGALYGIGDAVPLSNILLRALLMLFPLLRLSAFFVFLLFVTKKQLAAVVGALGATLLSLGMIEGSAVPFLSAAKRVHGMLSIPDLLNLCTFDNWRTYDLTLTNYYTYYPELHAAQIVPVIICSLVMCAVWLLLGYHFFHVDDMN